MGLKQFSKIDRKHKLALSYVWLSSGLSAVLALVTQVLLARILGTESYGMMMAAIALIGFVTPLAGFGVSGFWLKCFGKEGWPAIRWLQPSFKFIVLTTVLVVLSAHLWGALGPNDQLNRSLIMILSWTALGTLVVDLVCSKFQLEENYAWYSIIQLLPAILKILSILLLTYFVSVDLILESIAWAYLVVSIILTTLLMPQVAKLWGGRLLLVGHGKKNTFFSNDMSRPTISDVFNETWVFGVAGVLYLVWSQGHIVLAKYSLGNSDAGVYSAAMVLITAVCLLPSIAYAKFMLPKIHRWANHDIHMLKSVYLTGNKIMFGFGLIAMFLVMALSSWVVSIIFGEDFAQAADVLNILALTLPVRFLGYSVGSLMVTKHYMKLKIMVLLVVAVVNVILALIFMPIWGLEGLAVTIVISEVLLIFCYYVLVRRKYMF